MNPDRSYRVRQADERIIEALDGRADLDLLPATRTEIDLVPVA